MPSAGGTSTGLMALPREIRDEILKYVLPTPEKVNLSRLPRFHLRSSWRNGQQPRSDPPILSVNKQLCTEGTDILYRRNFIIAVDYEVWNDAANFDPTWRGFGLTDRFPFHKAKQITLCLELRMSCSHHLLYLFNYMLYMCGLLFGGGLTLQSLRIEVHRYFEPECCYPDNHTSIDWQDLQTPMKLHENLLSLDETDDNSLAGTKLLLYPLGLGRNTSKCEIILSASYRQSQNLNDLARYYERVITGVETVDRETTDLLWDRNERVLWARECRKRSEHNMVRPLQKQWREDTYKFCWGQRQDLRRIEYSHIGQDCAYWGLDSAY